MTLLRKNGLTCAVLSLVSFLASPLQAQQAQKAEYVFRGKVEQVDAAAGKITVANEPIEGWMGAMTMPYAVDKPEILKTLKVGDQIAAKVYQGDLMLHDIAVVPAQPSAPGTAKALRLADLEALALANNPTMAQAEANRRIAAGLTKQAGLYPNPTIGYYGDEIRGGYSGGGKQGGFISQTIVMGGKRGAARRVAELQAGQVETTGQAQRLRILNGVRTSFYHVLAAQRLEAVRQQLLRLAADATQTTRQLGNVGQADRPDLLQAEVEEQQASVGLRVATQNLQAAWRMLAAVCGKPDLPLTRLEGDFDAIPELTYVEWLGKTLSGSPEVRLASQEVERAEASLALARKAPVPDLQIYANLSHNNSPLIETNPARATGVQGGAQVGVQIPIFNRNQGNIE
ncbi:MAG TPA: TolC family protein, partial [Bryobacteraceae bacterium]|nr:TolC family protein [Bryobacteraceae bacterium]